MIFWPFGKQTQTFNETAVHPAITRARFIARWMDSAYTIPIIRKKIGLDPLLGLLPVSGDVISALIGLYLVYLAYELGLPKAVMTRMGINILLDLLIGAIPVVGDLSDMFIKSNQWNLQILENAYAKYGSPIEQAPVLDVTVEA